MSTPKPIGTDGPLFKCPICKKLVPNAQVASFPFCSERCRLVDLNKWLDGSYVTSRPIDPTGNDDEIPRRMPPNSSSSSNPADSN